MATKRGSHVRSGNQQGSNQQPVNYQNSNQSASSSQQAYEEAYRSYVSQQRTQQAQQTQQVPYQQNPYRGSGSNNRASYDQRAAGQDPRAYQQYGGNAQSGGYTPVRGVGPHGDYQGYNQSWNAVPKKKGHPVRNTFIVILLFVLVFGGFAGFTGYRLYNSAKVVKADASKVMTEISDLKDQILAENPDQANATAKDIAKRSENMKQETSSWEWTVGSFVPVYGSDIAKVKELANVFDDLADEAIVPLVSEVSQISLKSLISDGTINVELAARAVNAVNDAAPIIEKSAAKLDKMGTAELEQVNGPLVKAREKLDKLNTATQFVAGIAPTFTDMLGADGQRRTYLIVAQNNSEIRSTGGFLGSIGPMYVENGKIDMGDFRYIYDIYPDASDNEYAPLTQEEIDIFGRHVSYQIADSNFIPDFSRVSEIVKYAWERKGYGEVDGVIGVDPVFLQKMLAIAGPITTSTGIVVDGTNAATLILHDVYYMPVEVQDPFFEEVAALSFHQIMSHLGDISLTDFAKMLNTEMDARRLQAWMAYSNEESSMEILGCDGELSHDEAEPTLGMYLIDESYSKLFWYVKAENTIGEPTTNADGSKTYPVTVTYRNMLPAGGEAELSDYMAAHNPLARSKGEMIAWVMLSAPAGGRITDMVCTSGEFMPEGTTYRSDGSYVSGTMTESTLQGLDFWYGLSRTMPGNEFTLSFKVTTSPKATEPLKFVRTPTAQEVAGW